MHIEAPPRRRHGISLTPLIDVVFILLLFFMLATSFTDWRQIALATGTTAASVDDQKPAVVYVTPDGSLGYGGKQRSVGELARLLSRQHDAGRIEAVVVQPRAQTSLGLTVRALDALAGTGLPVALAAATGPGTAESKRASPQ